MKFTKNGVSSRAKREVLEVFPDLNRVKLRCLLCGNEYIAVLSAVMRQKITREHGGKYHRTKINKDGTSTCACPHCGGAAQARRNLSEYIFKTETLGRVIGGLEIIGRIITRRPDGCRTQTRTRYKVRCTVCGHEYITDVSTLHSYEKAATHYCGCAECRKKQRAKEKSDALKTKL